MKYQRASNFKPRFTDQELITVYLFGHLNGLYKKKAIYRFARHYWATWFPDLSSYQAFNRRLNLLESTFRAIGSALLNTLADPQAAEIDHLIDSMPGTKNDHFSEMLMEAHKRGFAPRMICFDSWYSSIENLKLVRGLGWHFLTRLKSNRQVNPDRTRLQAVSEIEIGEDGRVVWLKGFGLVKVFRNIATDGTAQHWASSQIEITELERVKYADCSWRIQHFHRGIKQQCLIERTQCRRRRQWQNHIGLCLRAFLRLESHYYHKGVSWFEAKTEIIRDAVRAYLANSRCSLISTA